MNGRALRATARNAVAEAVANRRALLTQATVMFVNDGVWVVFWVLFFRKVGSVRGWDVERILLLQAVLTCAGGITLGFLANARRIGRMAVAGELDAVLSLPVPPLSYLLLRRIEPINVGDVVFGTLLFLVACGPTPLRTVTFLAVVAGAVVLMTGFLVLTGSVAFFAGRNDAGELGFQGLLMMGSYPVDVFGGIARIVLYSVVPAAFVAAVPARLVDRFDPGLAVGLVVAAAVFAVAGWAVFTVGLRRYTSGAVWTRG